MQGKETYQYDFSYSLAFEKLNPVCDSQKLLLACGHIIIRLKCLRSRESQQIIAGLLRLPIYFKIGRCLLEICTIVHELKTPSNTKQQLQKIRQQLYTFLQDLSRILSADKQEHLPLIIILYYISIKKLLYSFAQFPYDFNTCSFFHTIYWQLKGQMTTNKYMESLIQETFKPSIFSQFQVLQLNQINEFNKIDLSQSMSLKKKQIKPQNSMLQSFKDIKLLRPDLIVKQNFDENRMTIIKQGNRRQFMKKKQNNNDVLQVKTPKNRLPIKLIK